MSLDGGHLASTHPVQSTAGSRVSLLLNKDSSVLRWNLGRYSVLRHEHCSHSLWSWFFRKTKTKPNTLASIFTALGAEKTNERAENPGRLGCLWAEGSWLLSICKWEVPCAPHQQEWSRWTLATCRKCGWEQWGKLGSILIQACKTLGMCAALQWHHPCHAYAFRLFAAVGADGCEGARAASVRRRAGLRASAHAWTRTPRRHVALPIHLWNSKLPKYICCFQV